jgi:hypothetical protein
MGDAMRERLAAIALCLLIPLGSLTPPPAVAAPSTASAVPTSSPALLPAAKKQTVRSGAVRMKPGVTYLVRLNSKKYRAVKLTRKCSTTEAYCNLSLFIGGKKVSTGVDTDDSVAVFGLLSVSSTTALVYRTAVGVDCADVGAVYRYTGKKLAKVAALAPELDKGCTLVRDATPFSAGSGRFTLRLKVVDWLDDDVTYAWNITYAYANKKASLAKVITWDSSNTSRTGAAANAYGKYCPGYVPGNTTDVYTQQFDHAAWGRVVFVACENRVSVSEPVTSNYGTGKGVAAVVDAAGRVKWSSAPGTVQYTWEAASPATDASGNIFVKYNPGRYDGYQVFRPTANGMTGLADFYYAELIGPGSTGYYQIRQYDNDCNPSCAQGTTTSKLYSWNGAEYVAK